MALAGTCVWLAYVAYFKGPPAPRSQAGEPAAASTPDSSPNTAPRQASSGAVVLESKGYIVPKQQILVSPQVNGRLLELNIEEGQKVTQGDVIARIESIEYQADYQQAVASAEIARQRLLELERGTRPEEIAQAKKELEEFEATLENLHNEYERLTDLFGTKAVSRDEFEAAESSYRAMQRRVERFEYRLELLEKGPREEVVAAARAELQLAQANVDKAKWRLDNCVIEAPISGTILRKTAEQGNIVNPVAFNGSFSLCEMADLARLEVDLTIQERDIARVFKGQQCQVRAEAFPDRVYHGVVSRLMPIADRAKGAVPVRVELTVPEAEEGMYLKPEMGAVVAFYAADQRAP